MPFGQKRSPPSVAAHWPTVSSLPSAFFCLDFPIALVADLKTGEKAAICALLLAVTDKEATLNATTETNAPQTRAFEADVTRLLHLMVHSIYSDRDIFLRELVSNAADACEKLRYEAIANPSLTQDGAPFVITLTADKKAKTLVISDNGVGMDALELASALGTIASSGTRAFLERLAAEKKEGEVPPELIGQFGIGFYSAFMVADKVEVASRRAGTDNAHLWSSDGKGAYTIAPLALDQAPLHGTSVTLHLSEASSEYAESWKLEHIVREHSGAITVPIDLVEEPGKEPRRIAEGVALWAKPKASVTEAEYTDFYRSLAGQYDEPAMTSHWRAEGRHEYTALAFIPGSRPLDLFDPARKGRAKLYVRRVLINADADLLPGWLRFVRALVDSSDLPLNVSREMIQQSAVFAAIRKGVTTRIVQDLTKLADAEPEKYAKIWDNFGAVIKEGLYEDFERRDALFKLARFATSTAPEGKRSLAEYMAALRPNQTAIYYLAGDDIKRLAASPQLEGFAARGIEVLLLPDPVDAFWVQTATGFDGKPFKSVTQGNADIKAIPMREGEAERAEVLPDAQTAALLAFLKETLAGQVEDVRASDRLSTSTACLVAAESGPDRRLEQMLAQHGQLGELSKPVLEINAGHGLVVALAKRLALGQDKEFVEDAAWLVYDEARLMDGEKLLDASAFAARLTRVLAKAAA